MLPIRSSCRFLLSACLLYGEHITQQPSEKGRCHWKSACIWKNRGSTPVWASANRDFIYRVRQSCAMWTLWINCQIWNTNPQSSEAIAGLNEERPLLSRWTRLRGHLTYKGHFWVCDRYTIDECTSSLSHISNFFILDSACFLFSHLISIP